MQALKVVDFTPRNQTPEEEIFKKQLMRLAECADAVDNGGRLLGRRCLALEFTTALSCFVTCVNDKDCRGLLERLCRYE